MSPQAFRQAVQGFIQHPRHTRPSDQANDDSVQPAAWNLPGPQPNQHVPADGLNLDPELRLCRDLWCRFTVKVLGIVPPGERVPWLVHRDRLVDLEATMPPMAMNPLSTA